MVDILKRLIIITLEDAVLTKHIIIIIWMMVASYKNIWKPTNEQINWILNWLKREVNIYQSSLKLSGVNKIKRGIKTL